MRACVRACVRVCVCVCVSGFDLPVSACMSIQMYTHPGRPDFVRQCPKLKICCAKDENITYKAVFDLVTLTVFVCFVFVFAKHSLVGHLFRNLHPSITKYLSLSLSHFFTSLQFYIALDI